MTLRQYLDGYLSTCRTAFVWAMVPLGLVWLMPMPNWLRLVIFPAFLVVGIVLIRRYDMARVPEM